MLKVHDYVSFVRTDNQDYSHQTYNSPMGTPYIILINYLLHKTLYVTLNFLDNGFFVLRYYASTDAIFSLKDFSKVLTLLRLFSKYDNSPIPVLVEIKRTNNADSLIFLKND